MLGKVIFQYAQQLAANPATLGLVPLYLCHLRQAPREALAATLLSSATDALDDGACQALYMQLAAATEGWHARQLRLDDDVLSRRRQPGPWWRADEGGDDDDEEDEEEGGGGARARQASSCLFGDLRWGGGQGSAHTHVHAARQAAVSTCIQHWQAAGG